MSITKATVLLVGLLIIWVTSGLTSYYVNEAHIMWSAVFSTCVLLFVMSYEK